MKPVLISKFYEENEIDDDFDEIEYGILYPETHDFYRPYCEKHNIDDRHRLFYHYYFYGEKNLDKDPYINEVERLQAKELVELPNIKTKFKVSYCTTCCNRLWQLEQTLPSNIQNLRFDEQIVIVNYSSKDGLHEWMINNYENLIGNQIKYIHVLDQPFYHCPIAKNIAHYYADGEYVVNLDSDNFLSGMRDVVDSHISEKKDKFVLHMGNNNNNNGQEWNYEGSYGRICFNKKDFISICGYNEIFLPIAYQDTDIIHRSTINGFKLIEDQVRTKCIQNHKNITYSSEEKTYTWHKCNSVNRKISHNNIKNKNFQSINIKKNITCFIDKNPEKQRITYHNTDESINFIKTGFDKIESGLVSLIVLNWERQENVIDSLNRYTKYNTIKDIIVVNNNKLKPFAYDHPKVKVINANQDLGLFSRYAASVFTASEAIIFIDDDMIVNEQTINKLYQEWIKDKFLVHGLIGREIKPDMTYDDSAVTNTNHDYPIVLTRCCITHKDVVIKTLHYSHDFNKRFYDAQPLGNGEDILMSMVALKHNNKNNKVYNFPYSEYENNKKEAIHKRWAGHYSHRSDVVKWCMENINVKQNKYLSPAEFKIISKQNAQNIETFFYKEISQKWNGTGIVMSVGGLLYAVNAYINIRYIIDVLKTKLPFELWYYGEEEYIYPIFNDLINRYGDQIKFVDAKDVAEKYPFSGNLKGYPIKPFCITYSRFDTVVFLDSDCFLNNFSPEHILSTNIYKKHEALFCPDIALFYNTTSKNRTFDASKNYQVTKLGVFKSNIGWDYSEKNPLWDILDIKEDNLPEFESGLICINKTKHSKALFFTLFLNEYHQFVYQYICGDKDTFKLAWSKYGNKLSMLSDVRPNHKFIEGYLDGQILYQHRVKDSKYDINKSIQDYPNNLQCEAKNFRIKMFDQIKKLIHMYMLPKH